MTFNRDISTRVIVLTAFLALTIGLEFTVAENATARGELSLIKDRCPALLFGKECTVRGMNLPSGMVMSADGRNVYVANDNGYGITVLDRNPSTGSLTQKPGPKGCIVFRPLPNLLCTQGSTVDNVSRLVLSSDGKDLYALGYSSKSLSVGEAIIHFRRDQAGSLSQDTTTTGCTAVDGLGGECSKIPLEDIHLNGIAIAPNSGYVLLTGLAGKPNYSLPLAGRSSFALTLKRDPTSGALTASPSSCLSHQPLAGCSTTSLPLDGSISENPPIEPDLAHLVGREAITTLSVDVNGALNATSCLAYKKISGCDTLKADSSYRVNNLTVGPDKKTAYLVLQQPGGPSSASTLIRTLDRSLKTGKLLLRKGRSSCISSPFRYAKQCRPGRRFERTIGVGVAPNGKSAYITSFSSRGPVTVFSRDANGELTQLKKEKGCLSYSAFYHHGCTYLKDKGLGRKAIQQIISPDSAHLYLLQGYRHRALIGFSIKQ